MTSNMRITCTKKIGQNFRIFYNEAEVEALGLQVGDIVEITTTVIKENVPDLDAMGVKRVSKPPRGTPPMIATRWTSFSTLMKNLSNEHPQGIPVEVIYLDVAKKMEVDESFTDRLLNAFKEVGYIFEPKKGLWLWSD